MEIAWVFVILQYWEPHDMLIWTVEKIALKILIVKGKGAGLNSLISLKTDFTFYPLVTVQTCSFMCHSNSMGSIQSCSHFGVHVLNLLNTLPSLSYQVLIFTKVKWSIWGWSALPKDTTSRKWPKIERGEPKYFPENPAQSRVRNRATGSDIGKAQHFNHCAMSFSNL